MNLSNLTLPELKKLRRDIDNEISEREEREARDFREFIRMHLGGRGMLQPTSSESRQKINSGNLIGVDELAERLGVLKCHIYRLTSIGRIPVIKVGKYSRYDYEEVLKALNPKEALA